MATDRLDAWSQTEEDGSETDRMDVPFRGRGGQCDRLDAVLEIVTMSCVAVILRVKRISRPARQARTRCVKRLWKTLKHFGAGFG